MKKNKSIVKSMRNLMPVQYEEPTIPPMPPMGFFGRWSYLGMLQDKATEAELHAKIAAQKTARTKSEIERVSVLITAPENIQESRNKDRRTEELHQADMAQRRIVIKLADMEWKTRKIEYKQSKKESKNDSKN